MFFVEFPGASYHNRSNKNNLEKFFLTLEQSYLCYYQQITLQFTFSPFLWFSISKKINSLDIFVITDVLCSSRCFVNSKAVVYLTKYVAKSIKSILKIHAGKYTKF